MSQIKQVLKYLMEKKMQGIDKISEKEIKEKFKFPGYAMVIMRIKKAGVIFVSPLKPRPVYIELNPNRIPSLRKYLKL